MQKVCTEIFLSTVSTSNAASVQIEVPQFLWHYSRDSEILKFFIL